MSNYAPPGMLSAVILEQDKEWQDVTGRVQPLEDLDRSHLARLEPFLLRHGESLRWNWVKHQTRLHSATAPTVIDVDDNGDDVLGPPQPIFSDNGGNMDLLFHEWIDEEMSRPLAEWLADRPLLKRIRELVDGE